MAEPEQQIEDGREARALYIRLGAAAIGLVVLAIPLALIEPDAPGSFFEGRGVFVWLLLPLAVFAAAARWLVERRRGKAPLAGPWWMVMRAKILFQLAWLGALSALGIVTILAWSVGAAWTEVSWRAWLVLIVGGAFIGLAGTLVSHLLFLMLPRRT